MPCRPLGYSEETLPAWKQTTPPGETRTRREEGGEAKSGARTEGGGGRGEEGGSREKWVEEAASCGLRAGSSPIHARGESGGSDDVEPRVKCVRCDRAGGRRNDKSGSKRQREESVGAEDEEVPDYARVHALKVTHPSTPALDRYLVWRCFSGL